MTAKEAKEISRGSNVNRVLEQIKIAAEKGFYVAKCSQFVSRNGDTTEAEAMATWKEEVEALINLGYSVKVEKYYPIEVFGFYTYYLVASW